MTSTEVITVIAAVGGLVTIIGGVLVNVVVALRSKVDEVNAKVDVVKGSVDGQATAAASREESLQKELKFLREMLADRKETAALLAQSITIVPPRVDVAHPETAKSLDRIDVNTSETAKNTARVEAEVKGLTEKNERDP